MANDDTIHLTMRNNGAPNAYSKVLLKPGGQLSVSGDVTAASNDPMSFQAFVYDSSQPHQLKATIVTLTGVLAGSTRSFTSSTFTHTGTTAATYYIVWQHAAANVSYLMPESNITIHADTAKLTLFLNAHDPSDLDPTHVNDTHFTTADPNGTNDANKYVPGARMTDNPDDPANGTSWPLPTATTPIQSVKVIAAFVDDSGAIVPPPAAASVTFTLDDDAGQTTSSAFDGVAMNWQDSRVGGNSAADFVLLSTSSSFTNNTASVVLQCWDYGGFATVTAKYSGASTSMRLPLDANHNWMPDVGWKTVGQPVLDDNSRFTDTETGPSGNLNQSDGFVGFEEFRGFVAKGLHVRLDPAKKDLFVISTLVDQQVGFVDNLFINVIPAYGAEAEQADLYINYRWQNYTVAETDTYTEYAANRYVQKAPMLINGVYNVDHAWFGATFTPDGVYEPYPPSAVVAPSKIYMDRIKEFSPSNNNRTTDDPYDYEAMQATITHEMGHQVGLDHFAVGGTCPLSANQWSVMVDVYFPQTITLNDCAWTQIPHVYLPAELSSFILR